MKWCALLLAASILPLLGASSAHPVTIALEPQQGSNERGTAVITRAGGVVIVDVRVTGMPPNTPSQLVHLHRGPCDRLSLREAIDLDPLVAGRSRTVLRGAEAARVFASGAYFVSVHKMLANVSSHVACGGPVRAS